MEKKLRHYRKDINNWFCIIQIIFYYILRQALLCSTKLFNYCHVCGREHLT